MTFLPVVERELRVAARKRSTFWLRIAAALVALVIGCAFLLLTKVGFGFGAVNLGRGLFAVLTWLGLAAALSAGLFFTSDCLSEEKRDGTIGFLFLTDLRGYDVVLGKLLATSLRGFYALLAVLPVLAVTLLMGGVTGGQFWKTSLGLLNALLISLGAGLFVSAISRDSQKALSGTLLLVIALAGSGPAIDATLSAVNQHNFNPALSLSSPVYIFLTASVWGQSLFWPGLLINAGIASLLLGLTCVVLPHAWQEKAVKASSYKGSWGRRWKFGGMKRQERLRRTLLGLNPVLWLACRERWQAMSVWAVAILLAGGGALTIFTGTDGSGWWLVWNYLTSALSLVLYLAVASQAGRFFVDAQRSRLLELLLSTPLTAREILEGQWRALLRMFGPPLVVCLIAQFCGAYLQQQMTWRQLAASTPTPTVIATTNSTSAATITSTTTTVTVVTPAGTTVSAGATYKPPPPSVIVAISVAGTLTIAANLLALVWFGMWMGLNSKSSNLATLKTIVFVQVIPWFAISFVSGMAMPLLFMTGIGATALQMMSWFPLIFSGLTALLCLAKDFGFWIWARRKLYSELRERAAGTVAPLRLALPPPLPGTSMGREKKRASA